MSRDVVAVAAGGAVGTLLRYGALEAYPVGHATFPTTVFVVNVIASFALGWLLARLDPRGRHPLAPASRPFLVAGVVGAFGTLSAVVVDTVLLLNAHRVGVAATYLVGTFVVGVAALLVGIRLGGWHLLGGSVPEEDVL
ncbi:MAG TPA: CrcB family protein [Acidimicrobiia bacterium]|nr:CrcB family protein [Acidimicrobiia bacterium]